MQIMIDINVEAHEALDLASKFLADHAKLKRALLNVPAGTAVPPVVLTPGDAERAVGMRPELVADFGPFVDPATRVLPLAPSNVVPFVPPPPVIPHASLSGTVPSVPGAATMTPGNVSAATTTEAASVSSASPTNAPTAAGPAATTTNNSATPATGAVISELDSTGLPWDERIHASGKSRNKDGSWRLRRGVEPATVTSVTQELHARMINSVPAPPMNLSTQEFHAQVPVPGVPAVAPTFPGSVPVPPFPPAPVAPGGMLAPNASGVVPVPPVPAVGGLPTFGKSPLPPGVTPAAPPVILPVPPVAASVPVPPAPALGVPDAGHATMVPTQPMSDYRQFMDRALKLRNEGKITTEQMNAIVQQAGAPSMQLLGSMLHLIPRASFILDATLAGWTPDQISIHLQQTGQ